MKINEIKDIEWIPGFEGHYKIDKEGNVFSYKSSKGPKHLNQYTNKLDYNTINLSLDGVSITYLVHQLVMNTYGPPQPYPKGNYVITHIDKNKSNNNINNLKWIKRTDITTRPRIPIKATGIDDHDVIRFRSITDCAKYFHSNQSRIRAFINDKKPYKGYLFEDLIF